MCFFSELILRVITLWAAHCWEIRNSQSRSISSGSSNVGSKCFCEMTREVEETKIAINGKKQEDSYVYIYKFIHLSIYLFVYLFVYLFIKSNIYIYTHTFVLLLMGSKMFFLKIMGFFSHFRHWHPEVWSLMSSHSKSPNAYKVTVMHLNRKKDELIMVLLGVLFQTLPTSIKADIHRQQTLDFQQQNPLAASRSRFVVSLSLNPWNEASSNCTLLHPSIILGLGAYIVHTPSLVVLHSACCPLGRNSTEHFGVNIALWNSCETNRNNRINIFLCQIGYSNGLEVHPQKLSQRLFPDWYD